MRAASITSIYIYIVRHFLNLLFEGLNKVRHVTSFASIYVYISSVLPSFELPLTVCIYMGV